MSSASRSSARLICFPPAAASGARVKFSAVSAPEIVDAGAPAPKAGESDAQQAQLRPPPIFKQAPVATLELAGIYRVSGTNPDGSQYHGMVALSRNRDEFTLTWWIGEQVLHGTGRVADKMLVVNWGDKDPAIYTFGDGGVLDGVWADGSATETLVPIATSASEPRALWPGKYKAEGRNPNGTRYAGTVTITKHGKVYQLSWAIGSTSYKGSGTLKDNLLIVNWGSPTPVIYALTDDGSLSGLWDAGRGEETLRPPSDGKEASTSYDPKLAALRQTAVIGTLRTSMLRLSMSLLGVKRTSLIRAAGVG